MPSVRPKPGRTRRRGRRAQPSAAAVRRGTPRREGAPKHPHPDPPPSRGREKTGDPPPSRGRGKTALHWTHSLPPCGGGLGWGVASATPTPSSLARLVDLVEYAAIGEMR